MKALERYRLAVQVYAMTDVALINLNDAVLFKTFTSEEVIDLQRAVSTAMIKAQDFKEKIARELDKAEDPR